MVGIVFIRSVAYSRLSVSCLKYGSHAPKQLSKSSNTISDGRVFPASLKCGRTVTDVFLTSLAVADLLVCIICSPLLVVGILVHSGHTGVSYNVEQFLFYFSSAASIFNLTAIALDRHDAVLHPMSRRLTLPRCRPVLAGVWALSAAVAVVVYFMPAQFEFIVLALCFAFPFVAMVISYARILRVAKAAERRAASHQGGSSGKDGSKTDKTVKMVVIVVAVFTVSWIPSLISRLLKYVVTMTPDEKSVMEVTACLIAYGGSALNFLVYAFMSRRFKIGLAQLFRCHRFIQRVSPTADDDIGKTRFHATMATVQHTATAPQDALKDGSAFRSDKMTPNEPNASLNHAENRLQSIDPPSSLATLK
ncbi:substance-K receptor-like isoform X2 [Acanthaster planci]|uniref:Substance-K receptor-like isoform X2 n=1 Tax=Acanthaster planci TaxID=133434 RepID=A0A8B7Y304_ACAPL|nr:substance-K receptor-like isoform X2 [Acanthaster planci]